MGAEQDLRDGLGLGAKVVQLDEGQALLTGFIDPHMRMDPTQISKIQVMGTYLNGEATR